MIGIILHQGVLESAELQTWHMRTDTSEEHLTPHLHL